MTNVLLILWLFTIQHNRRMNKETEQKKTTMGHIVYFSHALQPHPMQNRNQKCHWSYCHATFALPHVNCLNDDDETRRACVLWACTYCTECTHTVSVRSLFLVFFFLLALAQFHCYQSAMCARWTIGQASKVRWIFILFWLWVFCPLLIALCSCQ